MVPSAFTAQPPGCWLTAWGLCPGRGHHCGSVASAQRQHSLNLGLSLTPFPCVRFLSFVIPTWPSECRVQPPRGAAVWCPHCLRLAGAWARKGLGAGPRVAALLTTCWARGMRGQGRQPQISGSAKCLFSSGKKKPNHLEDFFFFFLALSFRRNLGMLLFKEKKCLQCISHPFRSEHDLCEEMVFFKKLSWRYIPERCFCETQLLCRAVNASCNSVIRRHCLLATFLRAVKISRRADSSISVFYQLWPGWGPPLTLRGAVSTRFICLINIPGVYFNSPLKWS